MSVSETKAGSRMEELSVTQLLQQYAFVVPEIQREYVWGTNPGMILNGFFDDLDAKAAEYETATASARQDMAALVAHLKNTNALHLLRQIEEKGEEQDAGLCTNVGFLYSYKPPYHLDHDRGEDLYLIDGQQRFTTLIIALFYFSLKEERQQEFLTAIHFRPEREKIGFDYRVRAISHSFFINLLSRVKNLLQLAALEKSSWYLSAYSSDTTVKAIVGCLKLLQGRYNASGLKRYDYLQSQVKFWHFKTNVTTEGEELYITMNARGKTLADSEKLRAQLVEDEQDKDAWGKKWEHWQDFLWRHRQGATNTDDSFNEVLRWVQILEQAGQIRKQEDEEKSQAGKTLGWKEPQPHGLKKEALPLTSIELTFQALQEIFEQLPAQITQLRFHYTAYFRSVILPGSWLSIPEYRKSRYDPKAILTQLDCFQLLPLIQYCKSSKEAGREIDYHKLYRFASFLKNRAKDENVRKAVNKATLNAIRAAAGLAQKGDITELLTLKGVSTTLLSAEERFKLQLFENATPEYRCRLEAELWRTEDWQLNDGAIGHLLQASYHTHSTLKPSLFSYYKNGFEGCLINSFDLENFISLAKKYNTLTRADSESEIRNDIWAHMIPTEYYQVRQWYGSTHRYLDGGWNSDLKLKRHNAFMRMVLLIPDNCTDRSLFLQQQEKQIIQDNYQTVESIVQEEQLQKQLFILYLINRKKGMWLGKEKGLNYGASNSPHGLSTFFQHKWRFEHYDQRWGGAEHRWVPGSASDKKYLQQLLDGSFWNQ